MDIVHIAGLIALFIAVAFLVQGLFELTIGGQSDDEARLDKRIKQLRSAARSADGFSLRRNKVNRQEKAIAKLLKQMPRYGSLSEVLAQAGDPASASGFLAGAAFWALLGAAIAFVIGQSAIIILAAALFGFAMPFILLMRKRRKRLLSFEKQLPEAVDLIGRSLRAGHAFAPSVQMVADEMPEPIATEFRQVSEEISFGLSTRDALVSLTRRIPIDDLRYFVIAVLLQRETGGNLAEILDTIADLIRRRFKLLGQVRVLTAEGRLSAWILSLLPFVTGFGLLIINPKFMSVLWTDQYGQVLVSIALTMMAVGIFWLTRIVKVRI
ncbi:MAG: type II secretion system F family protein [Burkholderiaceae bacterium]